VVDAVAAEMGGDFALSQLHSADRVDHLLDRLGCGGARLEQIDFGGETLEALLADACPLDAFEFAGAVANFGGDEDLVPVRTVGEARGDVDVGTEVVTFAVEYRAVVEPDADRRELWLGNGALARRTISAKRDTISAALTSPIASASGVKLARSTNMIAWRTWPGISG